MCVVVKRIRSAITDTRFVEVPKPFSRGNKALFSCYNSILLSQRMPAYAYGYALVKASLK